MRRVRANDGFDSRDGFLFLGNQLALDFVNTRPLLNGEPAELLPDFSALLRWFVAAGLLGSREAENLQKQWGTSVRTQRTVEAMRELREKLRKKIVSWEAGGAAHPDTIAQINRLMAAHPMLTRLQAHGNETRWELYFEPQEPEDLFAPLAHSAAMLFARADRTRVRKCGNCVLHFLDTSKKGTRRWCSMQLCGNRLKVAAYAKRRREDEGQCPAHPYSTRNARRADPGPG